MEIRILAACLLLDGRRRFSHQAALLSPALCFHQMDVIRMIEELRTEREQIEETILVLERIARGQGRRRGRPPAWMTGAPKRRGRPPGSKNKPKGEVARLNG